MVRYDEQLETALDHWLEKKRLEYREKRRKLPKRYRSRAAFFREAFEFALSHEMNTGNGIGEEME